PAIVLDLLWPKLNALWPDESFSVKWQQAIVAGIVYVAALMLVQWPFANFLMSPAAANAIFGTQNHPYMAPSDWYGVRNLFVPTEGVAKFAVRMSLALVASILCTRLGIMFGNWMRKVQR